MIRLTQISNHDPATYISITQQKRVITGASKSASDVPLFLPASPPALCIESKEERRQIQSWRDIESRHWHNGVGERERRGGRDVAVDRSGRRAACLLFLLRSVICITWPNAKDGSEDDGERGRDRRGFPSLSSIHSTSVSCDEFPLPFISPTAERISERRRMTTDGLTERGRRRRRRRRRRALLESTQ